MSDFWDMISNVDGMVSDIKEIKMGNEIQIRSIDDVQRVASIAAESRLFGVRNIEEAAVKIMYGMEMGLPVLSALMGVNVIQGKPTMSANLIASLVKRSGRYDYVVKRWDDHLCVIDWFTGGNPIGNSSFSIEDARRAGLITPRSGWEKYPKAMLFARALTQGARAYCADVFVASIYVPEELGGEDNALFIESQVTVKPTPIVTSVDSIADLAADASQPIVPRSSKPKTKFCQFIEGVSADPEVRKASVSRIYERLSSEGSLPTGEIDKAKQYKLIDDLVAIDKLSIDYCQWCLDSESGQDVVSDDFDGESIDDAA